MGLYNPAQIVGKPTVGVGNVGTAFKDDNFLALVQPAQPCGHRHPAGHPTNDHSPHLALPVPGRPVPTAPKPDLCLSHKRVRVSSSGTSPARYPRRYLP